MDASAVNVNVTVDDFDSVISYADQSVWQTPDPSSPSFSASGSSWLMGTYHTTDVLNASFAFNFTGMSHTTPSSRFNWHANVFPPFRARNLYLRICRPLVWLIRSPNRHLLVYFERILIEQRIYSSSSIRRQQPYVRTTRACHSEFGKDRRRRRWK
jgi:hypothetical protein